MLASLHSSCAATLHRLLLAPLIAAPRRIGCFLCVAFCDVQGLAAAAAHRKDAGRHHAGAAPLAPLLPLALIERYLGLAFAMAEGLLPPLLAVGSPGAAFGAAPLTPLMPPQL